MVVVRSLIRYFLNAIISFIDSLGRYVFSVKQVFNVIVLSTELRAASRIQLSLFVFLQDGCVVPRWDYLGLGVSILLVQATCEEAE